MRLLLFVSLTSVLNPDAVDHSCCLPSPECESGPCTHVSCRGAFSHSVCTARAQRQLLRCLPR